MNLVKTEPATTFKPGTYRVRLKKVFVDDTDPSNPLFIVNTVILESRSPGTQPGEQLDWVRPMKPGEPLPSVISFIGAAYGYCYIFQNAATKAFVTPELYKDVVSPRNPLAGRILDVYCNIGNRGKTDEEFTFCDWWPLPVPKQRKKRIRRHIQKSCCCRC